MIMKKIMLFVLCFIGILSGCDNRSAVQRAEDDYKQKRQKEIEKEMIHERYIDSLVNVATGLDGETLIRNRQNALNILRREYPEMKDRWDSVQESIDNMEVY